VCLVFRSLHPRCARTRFAPHTTLPPPPRTPDAGRRSVRAHSCIRQGRSGPAHVFGAAAATTCVFSHDDVQWQRPTPAPKAGSSVWRMAAAAAAARRPRDPMTRRSPPARPHQQPCPQIRQSWRPPAPHAR